MEINLGYKREYFITAESIADKYYDWLKDVVPAISYKRLVRIISSYNDGSNGMLMVDNINYGIDMHYRDIELVEVYIGA